MASLNEFRRNAENDYRTQEELDSIQSEITNRADEMSKDFIDELTANGVLSPDDLYRKREVVESTLVSYQGKFLKWLREQ